MKTTSSLYKTLRKQTGAFYEVELIQGTHTYTIADLYELRLYPALFEDSGPQVGYTHSTQCDVKFLGSVTDWPRMAQFSVRLRLSSADGTQKSEWISMGTYYTDERREDAYGNLSITAYDGMLLTEQYWTDKIREQDIPASWPITSKAWADMMVNAGLVEFDSRTVLDDTAAIIGLNTASTIRDNLKTIAAAHGGNWQITPEGKLRLIPLVNMVDGQAAIAGIAIAGISVVGDGTIESAEGLDYAFLGMDVQTFENSPALDEITGVNLETEAGNVAAAGTTTGYVLNASCEFASSVGAAELCLSKVQGYVYKPFSAGRALLDPAAEVGDLVIINGRSYQMMAIDWNINTWPTADIGAAYEQEVDHEYTILSPEAKTYRKSQMALEATEQRMAQRMSTIEQTESKISLRVSTLETKVITTYRQGTNPASDWQDPSPHSTHEGDLWYCTQDIYAMDGRTVLYEEGMTYRWSEISQGTYGWEEYGGVPSEIFTEIEGKAQVFLAEPTQTENPTFAVGYNEGDLWIQPDGTILTCIQSKKAGQAFERDEDWTTKIQYVDRTSMNSAVNSVDTKWENRDAATQLAITEAQTAIREIGTSLTIEDEYVQISHSHNNNILRLSGGEVKMMLGTDTLTYWNTNEMYTPKKVRIPTTAEGADAGNGGSLQIGGLVFQPRSNGNMSIMWVGDSTLPTTGS